MTDTTYILFQNSGRYPVMPFGKVTVAHGGCGPIAICNALLSMGQPLPLEEILAWFEEKPRRTFLRGRLGILPCQLKAFLRSRGIRVKTARSARRMDRLAREAEACILHYHFPLKKHGLWLPAAHYVEFSRHKDGYFACNTGHREGGCLFDSPARFSRSNGRFLPLGIFLYR